jgi:hypothetical protein
VSGRPRHARRYTGIAVKRSVLGITDSTIAGQDSGVTGMANTRGAGVTGMAANGPGVLGVSDLQAGIVGSAPNNVDVYGTGDRLAVVVGVSAQGVGIVGMTDTGIALAAGARRPGGRAAVFMGDVTIVGNLRVTGIKAAALKRRQGGQQLVYCVESPESWLEACESEAR